MNKKILIYGGSSLISLELIKIFLTEEYEFIIFCRNKNSFVNKLEKLGIDIEKFLIYQVDLYDLENNLKIIDQIKIELNGVIWVAGDTGDADEEFKNVNLAKKKY